MLNLFTHLKPHSSRFSLSRPHSATTSQPNQRSQILPKSSEVQSRIVTSCYYYRSISRSKGSHFPKSVAMSTLGLRALIPRRIQSIAATIDAQRYLLRRNLAPTMSVSTDARQTPSQPLVTPLDFKSLVDNHPATLEFQKRQSVILTRSALTHHQYNLTSTTLSGEGMVDPTPYVFVDVAARSVLAFYHLGRKLAGHHGIVHGGLSATLLDECMYKACLPRPDLLGKIAVTANLNINYKAPIWVETTILLRAETTKVEGRKTWVRATIEDVGNGQVYVVADALFIQPKWASPAEGSSDGRESVRS